MSIASLIRPRKQPSVRDFAGQQANRQQRQPHDPWWELRDRYVREMGIAHRLKAQGAIAAADAAFRCAWQTGLAWDYRIVHGPGRIPPSLVDPHRAALLAANAAIAAITKEGN